jgi:hypothetical protein
MSNFIFNTINNLSEGLTGIAASDKKDWALSAGPVSSSELPTAATTKNQSESKPRQRQKNPPKHPFCSVLPVTSNLN